MVSVYFSNDLEIQTMLRAAVVFKFDGGADSELFVGSPVFASGVRALLDSVIESCVQHGDERRAEGWRKTYRLSGHAERWRFVIEQAGCHPKWESLTHSDRKAWVDTVASPYWLSEDEFDSLQREVDRSR